MHTTISCTSPFLMRTGVSSFRIKCKLSAGVSRANVSHKGRVRAATGGNSSSDKGAMRRREAFLISGVSLAAAFSKPSLAYAEFCELTAAGPLQYCDIKVGKGSPVKEGDRVDLVYQGTDAKTRDTFDSSPSDEPLDVILGNDDVIIGWEMGIAGGNGMPPMRYGGVRKVIIPSKLAYGAEGYGCRYDITRKRRGGMDCMVDPYDEIEMVFKILDE